ncbi:hypothetical protein ACFLX7_05115 [Chloroflexota bacterium]
MPYIRDQHFARIRELLETIEELVQDSHEWPSRPVVHKVATRALKVVGKYTVS